MMKFKAILIGKSMKLRAQVESLYGFINKNLGFENISGSTILLATKETGPNLPLNQAPTKKVELVRVSDYQAETVLKVLQAFETGEKANLYMFPSGALEDDLAVRWAYRIKGSSLVQVQSIAWSNTELLVKKAVYANHVMATFQMTEKPYCISLARDGVATASIPTWDEVSVRRHDLSELKAERQFISKWIPEESVSDLDSAQFLVVGGRGIGSAAACQELEKNAQAMGADFGVSRPVALNAWTPMHRLIGVSGAITKPGVCIAAAVSGAAAFYAGIANSKKIIAINSDDQAPITKAADVVIIDDYKAILDALVKIVSKAKADEQI